MNIQTPLFRGAFSLSIMWLVVWMFISYHSYDTDYRNIDYALTVIDPNVFDECHVEKFDMSGPDSALRPPTREEQQACINIVREQQSRTIAENNNNVIYKILKSLLLYGLFPIVILLFTIAAKTPIFTFGRLAVTRYVSWLRYGRKGNDSE